VNAPPVTLVDDRRDVPRKPAVTLDLNRFDFYQRSVKDQLTRPMSLPNHSRALGVNALDEVPDSTWFTNRIGVRDLTPDEIRTGPLTEEGPDAYKPWTILSTKPGGVEVGFVIADTRGMKYLIKFDDADLPELETGTHVAINRLLWACGYNVPEDRVGYVRASELLIEPGARIKDGLGNTSGRLDRYGLDKRLASKWHTPDGRYRALVSHWLEGSSLGPSPLRGVRKDDVNDRIPHERRRDLRGQYAVFAWLDHTDLNFANFHDMWIADPRDPRRHYVEHYKIDFGQSLRVMSVTIHYAQESHAYSFDWQNMGWQLITIGVAPRPWGHSFAPDLVGVSPTFVADDFDPGNWHPESPYPPIIDSDRFDQFWGTRLVARFTRDQIHAAVEAGQFSDPRTIEYITDTLVTRQRMTEAYWFSRVNPLVQFATQDESICFRDLAIDTQLASAASTRYDVISYDARLRPLGRLAVAAATTGPTCTPAFAKSAAPDGYTIVKLTTSRPGLALATYVHIARDPSTGEWRVIGVWRI
jgi:hypothetical protein